MVGAEITLHEVPVLAGLGLTMTGARPGGFGALDARVNEICAAGDLICAAPNSRRLEGSTWPPNCAAMVCMP